MKVGADQRGMVTFELAVGILVASLIATVLVWTIGLISAKSHCSDLASRIATQIAREDEAKAKQIEQSAPSAANITKTVTATDVTVTCQITHRLGMIGPVTLVSRAWMPLENSR